MDHVQAIRLRALRAILDPTDDDVLRGIFRHYSKTFHTPLHVVRNLPLDDILQTFYEDMYESLRDEGDPRLQEELVELTETEDERIIREASQKSQVDQDDAFLRAAEEEAAKEKAKEQQKRVVGKPQAPKPPELPDISMKFQDDNLLKWAEQDGLGAPPPGQKT